MNGKWPGTLTAEIIESLSDEEFWRCARELALLTSTETLSPAYLRCELSCGHRLIPMTSLYEVVPPPHHFALLPAIPAWMRGIFAWHTETIAVVDLDAYLSANELQVGNGSAENEQASTGDHKGPPRHPSPLREPSPYGDPISPGRMASSTGTLLIAGYSGLAVGLLVPTLAMTAEPVSEYEASGLFILDIPVVLMDIVQQIRDSCSL